MSCLFYNQGTNVQSCRSHFVAIFTKTSQGDTFGTLLVLTAPETAAEALQPFLTQFRLRITPYVRNYRNPVFGKRMHAFRIPLAKYQGYSFLVVLFFAFVSNWGPRWRRWLRHCATNGQVASSIPDVVSGIFHWHNPVGRTMALGSAQPLTEMSTRNVSWGVKAAGA
jgi:hypothetical protein